MASSYRLGDPTTIAASTCCCTGTGECPRFPCSCCDSLEIPEQFPATLDAAFAWADGSCVGTSATTGTFGDSGFGGSGAVGDPCSLVEDFSGPGIFDGLTATLQSEDNVGTPCVWVIRALPTGVGCGAIAPIWLRVDDFDCCLETQTCTLTPLSVPSGWTAYPTQVTLTSCGCDVTTGTGVAMVMAKPRSRMVPLPVVPRCLHVGDPTHPPAGKSPLRAWYECEKGHGVVCQCDCRPEKCGDYQADL